MFEIVSRNGVAETIATEDVTTIAAKPAVADLVEPALAPGTTTVTV